MTYNQYELSRDEGLPIELYEFKVGTEVYRFTNNAQQTNMLGYLWRAVAVKRSQVRQSNDTFKDGVSFEFPITEAFAQGFITSSFAGVVQVTIYRTHFIDVDSEYATYWVGRATGATTSGSVVTINCESVFTSLKRPGLRAKYQLTCRHSLFGNGCYVNKDDFKLTDKKATNVDPSGTVVNIPLTRYIRVGDQLVPQRPRDHTYTNGYITLPTGICVMVLTQIGDSFTLLRRIRPDQIVNQQITIYQGCDKTKETCAAKFNNIDNFGGFPWIPVKNPYEGSIL